VKQRFWIIIGCGIVLLLAAALLSLLQGPGGILATVLLVAGGAVWTAAVLFSWRQLKGYLALRSARYGLNAFVLSFLVAVILVLVGALAARHAWRVDLTGSREYSLSDKTEKVLQGIRKRVDIYVYFDRAARDPARDLLREYVRRNRLLRLHLEELNKDPERAERFGVSSLGTIVFDAGDKVERIGAVSEEDVTNALIKVSRPGRKKVYFLTDHGEKDIANKGVAGYAVVAEALTRENYDPVTLSLTGGGSIPPDCEVLVIAGPKSGYLEHEKLAVQRYLESGRRVLFLFDPRYACGLEFYLRAWGVLVGDDRVVDPSPTGQLMGRGASTPLVNRYGVHPITRQFRQPTYFELVRSVRSWNLYNGRAERIVLAFTGEQSWAESDLISSQISFDANDMAGPVPIAVAVRLEVTGLNPEDESAISTSKPGEARVDPEALSSAGAAAANESRLVVVGDSEFANNRNFPDMGNGNLFMNCVAWLAQDEDLIAVRPKDPDLRRVALTKAQMGILNLIVLGLLPAAMAIAGVIVTVRRRARG